MNPSVPPTRRGVLVGAGAVIGVAVTAACSGDPEATETTSTPDGAGAGTTAAGEEPGAGTPAGALASVDGVPVGSAVSAKSADGKPIIIAQPEAGTVVAFSAICTHKACTVVPAGQEIACRCHGSAFDLATGAPTKGPATEPLPPYAVRVDGTQILPA